jgi:ABC-type metal ion transport system, ATPase component
VYENVALPLELAGMKRDEIEANVLPLLELVGLSAQKDRIRRRSAADRSSGSASRALWQQAESAALRRSDLRARS